jgi:hypothetical protein
MAVCWSLWEDWRYIRDVSLINRGGDVGVGRGGGVGGVGDRGVGDRDRGGVVGVRTCVAASDSTSVAVAAE